MLYTDLACTIQQISETDVCSDTLSELLLACCSDLKFFRHVIWGVIKFQRSANHTRLAAIYAYNTHP